MLNSIGIHYPGGTAHHLPVTGMAAELIEQFSGINFHCSTFPPQLSNKSNILQYLTSRCQGWAYVLQAFCIPLHYKEPFGTLGDLLATLLGICMTILWLEAYQSVVLLQVNDSKMTYYDNTKTTFVQICVEYAV